MEYVAAGHNNANWLNSLDGKENKPGTAQNVERKKRRNARGGLFFPG
jgi:hypothetical protein